MDQVTHSWIAVRAIALLEADGGCPGLIALLKPHAREASVGAWIPDRADAQRAGKRATPENHVLKMAPYKKSAQKERFVMEKRALLSKLGKARQASAFLRGSTVLKDAWWSAAYKADPGPGQHVANRAMAIGTTISDVLAFGDAQVEKLLPGDPTLRDHVSPDCLTHDSAAAMYFFMLSHFVADACMPCHCDGRVMSKYAGGKIHEPWEKHWSSVIGQVADFSEEALLPTAMRKTWQGVHEGAGTVLKVAREVDRAFDVTFSGPVPELPEGTDLWLDTVHVCRGSFALMGTAFPPTSYGGYASDQKPSFNADLAKANPKLLQDLDRAIMHDAVVNTAIAWKHLWNGFR